MTHPPAARTAPPEARERRTSLRERLVSAALWALGLAWLIAWLPALTLLSKLIPAHRTDALTRVYTAGQVRLTLCRWRALVHPNVDPHTPYLFVQNHINLLDHCTMYNATPHYKQGMELKSHFRIPFYGPFMRGRGTLAVEPGSPAGLRQLLRDMKRELAEGRSLLAFPEGTRTRTGRVAAFQPGIFALARQLKLPVVPVAVVGMHEVIATGEHVFRPFREVTVHVMEPMPTDEVSKEDLPAFVEAVRGRIAERVDAWYFARGDAP